MPDYPTLEPTARTNTAALLRPCWLDEVAIRFMTAPIAAGPAGFNPTGQRPARPRVSGNSSLRRAGTRPCTRLLPGVLAQEASACAPFRTSEECCNLLRMVKETSKSERMEIRKAIGNRMISGSDSGVRPRGPDYLIAHACFDCRKSWKLSEESTAICPQCSGALHWMGRAFKPPKRSDIEQWKKVESLWRAGFRFIPNTGWRDVEPYPERLREIPAFIENNRDHPFRVKC